MDIEKYFESGMKILKPVDTINTYGEKVRAYVLDKTITGRIRPLKGNEVFMSGARQEISTHRLYCAYEHYFDVTEDKQIEDDEGTTYDITAIINPMNFDEWLQVDLEVVK